MCCSGEKEAPVRRRRAAPDSPSSSLVVAGAPSPPEPKYEKNGCTEEEGVDAAAEVDSCPEFW